MNTLHVVVVVAAVWRIGRLVAVDRLTRNIRLWMNRRHALLGYLFECSWCITIWLGPVVVVPAVIWPTNRGLFAAHLTLAASAVAGMLVTVEDRLDR